MDPFSKSNSTVARISHQANRPSSSISIVQPPMDSASLPQAPTVPESVHEIAKKKAVQLGASIRAHLEDPTITTADALSQQADAWLATVKSHQSPITEAHRLKSLADWEAYLNTAQPDLSNERHWDRDIVEKYWPKFLFTMVTHSVRVRKEANQKNIKATTVSWWASLFLHSILAYTCDPITGTKCGMTLLVKEGVYVKLKAQVVELVHEYKLDRHKAAKIYFGRHELQLIIQTMLDASIRTGRQLVPVCGDITLMCHDYMDFELEWRMKIFKRQNAIGTVTGKEQTFNVRGCLYAHNVLFDIILPLIAHLFLLKRFKTKYESIEALCADRKAQLHIDPVFNDTPIFLAGATGGREFAVPERPAMATSVYEALRDWAQKSGLPGVGVTALRRDAGNHFGLQNGERIAKDFMNHQTDGPFRDSYSRNTANFNLVQLRIGEVAGSLESFPGQKIQENHQRHGFKSYAVEALVRAAREAPQAEETEKEKKAARLAHRAKLIAEGDLLQPMDKTRSKAWENYVACFNKTASAYKMCTISANRVLKLATGELEPPEREPHPLAFEHPWDEPKTKPLLDTFVNAENIFHKQLKKEMRRYDIELRNAKNKELLEGGLTGDGNERELVVQALAAPDPGKHVRRALEAAAAPANTDDLESVRSWVDSIHKARTALTAIDIDEGPGAAQAQADQDELFAYFDRLTVSNSAPELATVSAYRKAAVKTAEKDTLKGKSTDANADDSPEPDWPDHDVDESAEEDILKVPIADARRALLKYYVQPVLRIRSYDKYKITNEEIAAGAAPGYRCPRCKLYSHRAEPVEIETLKTIAHFERHMSDLPVFYRTNAQLETTTLTTSFYSDAESVTAVRKHALSGQCMNSEGFLAMAREREESTPKHDTEAYKDRRLYRSRKVNRDSDVSDSDCEESDDGEDLEPANATTLKGQVQDLLLASSATSQDDEETTILGELLEYLEDVQQLPVTKKGSKTAVDWDILELDQL
ncbi:hypothetical protein C8R44DRAFT_746619 [Mycena epipterygia]|nr:hypothetical protein C8R44DRAFT_746619 [Mycena epipterygia]